MLTLTPEEAKTPNPGSDEAVAMGCRCPVLDNGHGRGSGRVDDAGKPVFWISNNCPLHSSVSSEEASNVND